MNGRELQRAVIAFLREAGAQQVRIEHGGKHPRVVFLWEGREHSVTLSGSPSGRHALDNALGDLRRLIEPQKSEKKVGQRRTPRKARAQKAKAADCPPITALHDYRDELLVAKYRGLTKGELDVALWNASRALLREHMERLSA